MSDTITIEYENISLDSFKDMSQEEQKEKMKQFFYENYEDPAESCPYESREGGFFYIYGGPYHAEEELSVFYGYVDDELIEALASELTDECTEWSGKERYDEEYINLILSDNEFYKSFSESMSHVSELLKSDITEATKVHLLGLLHVSVITAIETYLSDAFINQVLNNKEVMRKFVEHNIEFSNEKFKLSDVYKLHEEIDLKVKKYLVSLLWHNLAKIAPIYRTTLDIEFPEKNILTPIYQAINIRHDLVHRNGKDTEGNSIVINEDSVAELITKANAFVDYINGQIDVPENNVVMAVTLDAVDANSENIKI